MFIIQVTSDFSDPMSSPCLFKWRLARILSLVLRLGKPKGQSPAWFLTLWVQHMALSIKNKQWAQSVPLCTQELISRECCVPSDSSCPLGSVLFPTFSRLPAGPSSFTFPSTDCSVNCWTTPGWFVRRESVYLQKPSTRLSKNCRVTYSASPPPIKPDIEIGNKESLYVHKTLDKGSQLLPHPEKQKVRVMNTQAKLLCPKLKEWEIKQQ